MDIPAIAKWIVNPDSTGCTDEEFAELIALIAKYRRDGNKTDPNLTVEDMKSVNTEEICNWFKECLDEILFSTEIDADAWWKK